MCEKVSCTGCGRAMNSTTHTPMCHPCRRERREARRAAQPKAPVPPIRYGHCEVCGDQYPIAARGMQRSNPRCTTHRQSVQRTCITCNTTFYATRGTAKQHCSTACLPKRPSAYVPKAKKEWHCKVCGVLVQGNKGPAGYYCKQHKRYRKHPCKTCGTVTLRDGDAQYCSTACKPIRERRAPRTDLQWKPCAHCGRWISRPGRKHCNKHCANEASATANGYRNRKCKRCGINLGRISHVQFCRPCIKHNQRDRRRKERTSPDYQNLGNHRHRAHHYGVEYEPVKRSKVLERDGWKCGICHKRINPKLKHPHLMSATIDHIVPMALGGGHTYLNTQAAHMICNSRKSHTGTGDQLALIG